MSFSGIKFAPSGVDWLMDKTPCPRASSAAPVKWVLDFTGQAGGEKLKIHHRDTEGTEKYIFPQIGRYRFDEILTSS
jgi:hypothetical protein